MMSGTFHITTLICHHTLQLNVILTFPAQKPPAGERLGQDQLEQVQSCAANPRGNTMDSTWRCLVISLVIISLVISHRHTAPVLLCRVFLQCGMEEAELGLQHRDEVIHQVGTETSVLGRD